MQSAHDRTETRKALHRVTWAGVWVNLFLAVVKSVAGWLGNSQAVLADGVHSFSDLVTDAAILIGSYFWTAPADAKHPHGHGRIETMTTLGIALALAVAALGIGWDALQNLREPYEGKPGLIALFAALSSIALKEWVYRWTMRVAKRHRSSAVAANAWHHRTDALSSIPAAGAVLAAYFAPGWAFVDAVGALFVCLFILKASRDIGKPALDQLVDRAAPPDTVDRLRRQAMAVDGVCGAHKVRTRYLGEGLQVDLHVEVDPEISVYDGHEIAHQVRDALLTHEEVVDVIVHVEPHMKDTQ